MKKIELKKLFRQFESVINRKADITIEEISAIPRFSHCKEEELLQILSIVKHVSKVALLCMEDAAQ